VGNRVKSSSLLLSIDEVGKSAKVAMMEDLPVERLACLSVHAGRRRSVVAQRQLTILVDGFRDAFYYCR
jgi:hypothetical protein